MSVLEIKIFWLHTHAHAHTHTYTHLYIVLCILQPWKHLRPHLISKPEHKPTVSPNRQISYQTKSICSFTQTHFYRSDRVEARILSLVKAHFGGDVPPRCSLSSPPDAQPPLPAFFHVSLAFITFHNDQLPLFHLYVKTNPDYLKYPTYNSPLLCSIPFDSRLTHIALGPIGVRLWGALKPPHLISFHHLTREALKPQCQLLLFFFSFFLGSPMRTGHPPIRDLFTFCD